MDLDTYPVAGQLLEGKYEIAELLGGGGMGAVFKAGHRLLQTPVALKFMAPHLMEIPGAIERFLNEGVAASRIDSNHVVKVLDVGKLPNGTPYLCNVT